MLLTEIKQNLFTRAFIVLMIETASLKASIKNTENTIHVHKLYDYVQLVAPGNKYTVAKKNNIQKT